LRVGHTHSLTAPLQRGALCERSEARQEDAAAVIGFIDAGNALDVNTRSNRGATMSIIGWIVLGLIAGFIASKLVNKAGEGLVLDIVLGIVGAIVGGFLFAQFGAQGVTGFNLYSMFVAVIGAVVVLVIYHAVVGRRSI
jgi:uncharacterized membrane protein YeaQ/YmgE (transglycosylase-associated protein family)